MKYQFGKTVVVALGGSVVCPADIDVVFLRQFKKFAESFARRGRKLVVVVGGGRLARDFQNAAAGVSPVPDEDKDWIGIHSTRLNAHLLRTIFRRTADPVVFDSRGKVKKLKYPVTVASGWRPGWSTDFVAAAIASDMKIPEFVVAGKPAFVYPVRSRARTQVSPGGAKGRAASRGIYRLATKHPYLKISWRDYRKLIPKKWKPGLHAPVDPVAAKLSDGTKLKAIIINGKNLKNFGRLLNGKEFGGTIIG